MKNLDLQFCNESFLFPSPGRFALKLPLGADAYVSAIEKVK